MLGSVDRRILTSSTKSKDTGDTPMGMTKQTKFAARVSLAAAALVGAVGISGGAVGAAPSHPSAPTVSPAGNYLFTDNIGDTKLGLTLNTNGTLAFAGGCAGLWVKSGSSIALDINHSCGSVTSPISSIFSGAVNSTGLSSLTHPGHLLAYFGTSRRPGLWYAVRV
jgi:hypothetical protein